jgi:hypothetical protein
MNRPRASIVREDCAVMAGRSKIPIQQRRNLGMRSSLVWTGVVVVALSSACGSDKRDSNDDRSDAQVGDASTPIDGTVLPGLDAAPADASGSSADAASLPDGSPFKTNAEGQVLCGTVICACSNGGDDDMDGLSDLADPECVSSWDNDEGSFATGIPGDNRDTACQDCFFDGNSGSGDDGCRVATSCLVNPADSTSGRGSCATCAATEMCRSTCQAYTPNGCDCFGCCTVHLGSSITKSVLLAPGCDINGTDTTGCTECVPSTTCGNTCGECELCPGKSQADLPASCASGGGDAGIGDAGTPTPTCDDGQQLCTTSTQCPSGQLCQFGCCQLSPILI